MKTLWSSRFGWTGTGVLLAAVLTRPAQAQVAVTTGTVIDSATGRTLPGAIIQMADGVRSPSSRTDERGGFQLQLAPGTYQMLVRRIGYAPWSGSKTVSAGDSITIRLSPLPQSLRAVRVHGEGAGIYGEIAGLDGLDRIKGAKVQVAGANAKVETDSAGTFFVPVKRAGVYAIRITARGYAMDFFTVAVKENEVADASRYLLSAERSANIPEMAWAQFDDRIRWAQKTNYALVPGADIRRYHGSLREAVQSLGAQLGNGARLGDFPPCIFLDGIPRPGMLLEAISIDEVKAIEVYGLDPWRYSDLAKEGLKFFRQAWTGPAQCLSKPVKTGTGKVIIAFVSVWTK